MYFQIRGKIPALTHDCGGVAKSAILVMEWILHYSWNMKYIEILLHLCLNIFEWTGDFFGSIYV